MKTILNPPYADWAELCRRPAMADAQIAPFIEEILDNVKRQGDTALHAYNLKFDKVVTQQLLVSDEELRNSQQEISAELKDAISIAAKNIRAFHTAQKAGTLTVETMPGVTCWRKSVAIESVGLYIPGGSAPLFSTLLMLAIPAQIAGCKNIVVCTPPGENGKIHPAILYTANFLGLKQIFKTGGAQAIAAMAFGTESIPKTDKIFGPGNQYVAKAKEFVQRSGVAIDLPAGPSEVLIIADEDADADFIAADLLSQAEHGADSQVVIATNNEPLLEKIKDALQKQLMDLPRAIIAAKALENSFAVLFDQLSTCMQFSNAYAPEHLILAVQDDSIASDIVNAGSVFIGNYSCESAGDYASGTNHTLPTNGFAKSYSGLSLDSFIKKITFQKINEEGIKVIGKTIETMAEAEQLMAHKNAVSIRLKKIYGK